MTLQNVRTKLVLMVAAMVLVVFISGCANPFGSSGGSSGSDSEDHNESSADAEDGQLEDSGSTEDSDSTVGDSEDGDAQDEASEADDASDENGGDANEAEDEGDVGDTGGDGDNAGDDESSGDGEDAAGESNESGDDADVVSIEQAFITGGEDNEAPFQFDEEAGGYKSDGSASVFFDRAAVGSAGVMVSFTLELPNAPGGEREVTLKTVDLEGDALETIPLATLKEGDTKEVSFTLDALDVGQRYELSFPGIGGGGNYWLITDLEVTPN